ncbi:MAG: M14 family metallopeptidase [Polyangiaceae bacterium]
MPLDLDALSLGFRGRFLTYAEITEQLERWQRARPDLVRVRSIAKSEEGRELWVATVGRDPDRVRPAVWIDGNIHASELSGSSVCLGVIEDLLRALDDPSAKLRDLPDHLRALVTSDVLFYVLPRMCPDGAERVIARHHFVRSNHRDHRLGANGPRWIHEDMDGDGLSLLMRKRDETGDFVASKEHPNVLVPREVEDEGPYYRVFPEGRIENFDGFTIPKPSFMSDTETDMNRNFSSGWQPEPTQVGAGAFATSEPESRGVTEFASRHPEIFAWLSFHTYGGVYIRPLGDKPDAKMAPQDAAVFRVIDRWAESIPGYPCVSGFMEFTYEPDKPLHGDLAQFAYAERGAIGFVCELWDFFKQVGFEVKRPFIKNYEDRGGRAEIAKIATWDATHNAGRIFGAWRTLQHPQIGEVEIGGYDPLVGIWNPPFDRLAKVCEDQSRFVLRLASLAPRLVIASVTEESIGAGLRRIEAVVENRGFLPTYVLESAKARLWNEGVRIALRCAPDVVIEAGEASVLVGHLEGWGGNDRFTAPSIARSVIEIGRRKATWIVRGEGAITVRASATRVGAVERTV